MSQLSVCLPMLLFFSTSQCDVLHTRTCLLFLILTSSLLPFSSAPTHLHSPHHLIHSEPPRNPRSSDHVRTRRRYVQAILPSRLRCDRWLLQGNRSVSYLLLRRGPAISGELALAASSHDLDLTVARNHSLLRSLDSSTALCVTALTVASSHRPCSRRS